MADLETWADTDDVTRFTGVAVSEDELVRAQDIIELFAGTTWLATDNISQGNLRRLNRAVAYQAAWMQSHPDVYMAVDVDGVSEGGASFSPSHDNAAFLAPLAARHLNRLTWKLAPLRVRRGYGQYEGEGNRDSAVADDTRTWTPS